MTFATEKELIEWLIENDYAQLSDGDWYPSGTYYLSYDEYSQPHFSPRLYKDGWSLYGYYYFYKGSFGAKRNGRVGEEFYWR